MLTKKAGIGRGDVLKQTVLSFDLGMVWGVVVVALFICPIRKSKVEMSLSTGESGGLFYKLFGAVAI